MGGELGSRAIDSLAKKVLDHQVAVEEGKLAGNTKGIGQEKRAT